MLFWALTKPETVLQYAAKRVIMKQYNLYCQEWYGNDVISEPFHTGELAGKPAERKRTCFDP